MKSVQTHLFQLEAEAIEITREVVSEAENPVTLYSVGKDSAVMLHLAKKAFYHSPPRFPLMHMDDVSIGIREIHDCECGSKEACAHELSHSCWIETMCAMA